MTTIKQKVEETIASIDGLQRAEANPYFYDKIMQRIKSAPARVVTMKPSMIWTAAACLVLLFGINLFTWIDYSKTTNYTNHTKTDATVNALVKDYFSTNNVLQF